MYELKGADSDITSLDVKKAISDLDKDKVLEQYQYFVGNKEGGITQVFDDGSKKNLRSGENFTL